MANAIKQISVQRGHDVTVIDVDTLRVVATVPVGQAPAGVVVFDALGTPPVEGALRSGVHALAQMGVQDGHGSGPQRVDAGLGLHGAHAGADQVGRQPAHDPDDGVLGGVVGRHPEQPVRRGRRGD